jgi:acetaldehyde dehydrogenase (acetylating)
LGSVGFTTNLMPSMTLGSGGIGGSITGDNITTRHLLNVKRMAYEVTPPPDDVLLGSHPSAVSTPTTPPSVNGITQADVEEIVRRVLGEIRTR